jgi:hypothetical protein
MDHRIFGKELTNLGEHDLNRYKRNHSFMQGDRLREPSLAHKYPNLAKEVNRSLDHKSKEQKLELTDPQMVPEYFFENMQFLRSKEKQTYKLVNYIPAHKTVSEQSRAKLIDWLSELHYKYKMFPETIFTVISLIDQYLSAKDVPLG